jgi:DNA-binding response OmpR family regulator
VPDRSVLVIEDELDIAQLVKLHLDEICNDVVIANNGHDGLLLAKRGHWDLIILDLRLPGIDGLEICRQLRQSESYVPVLMLTAKSSELDRVLGLEIGADDYLTKPFSVQELVARVRSIFRRCDALRAAPVTCSEVLTVGELHIDIARRQATRCGKPLELTAREFDLLHHFASHPGRVFTRTQLLDNVWGYGHDGYEHTVNSHINRLRAKIELQPDQPRYIITVWGVGYRFGS